MENLKSTRYLLPKHPGLAAEDNLEDLLQLRNLVMFIPAFPVFLEISSYTLFVAEMFSLMRAALQSAISRLTNLGRVDQSLSLNTRLPHVRVLYLSCKKTISTRPRFRKT